MANKCQKFFPNIFNKSRCQQCFKDKDTHSTEALDYLKASRKISKCGYLFVAPEQFDFQNPIDKTRRWQRRFFIFYDDGELTYSVDENADTIPQGVIDMTQCNDVIEAQIETSHQHSLKIDMPKRQVYIKGANKDEINRWYNVLVMYPRSLKIKHRRSTPLVDISDTTDNKKKSNIVTNDNQNTQTIDNSLMSTRKFRCMRNLKLQHHCDDLLPRSSSLTNLPEDIILPHQKRFFNLLNGETKSKSIYERYANIPKHDDNFNYNGSFLNDEAQLQNTTRQSRSETRQLLDNTNNIHYNSFPKHNMSISSKIKFYNIRNATDELKINTSDSSPAHTDSETVSPIKNVYETEASQFVKKGWLNRLKTKNNCRNKEEWEKFWFVLNGVQLKMFKDARSEEAGELITFIDLSECCQLYETDVGKNYGFIIKTKNDCITLSAMTTGIRNNWLQSIKKLLNFIGIYVDYRSINEVDNSNNYFSVESSSDGHQVSDIDENNQNVKQKKSKAPSAKIKEKSRCKSPRVKSPPPKHITEILIPGENCSSSCATDSSPTTPTKTKYKQLGNLDIDKTDIQKSGPFKSFSKKDISNVKSVESEINSLKVKLEESQTCNSKIQQHINELKTKTLQGQTTHSNNNGSPLDKVSQEFSNVREAETKENVEIVCAKLFDNPKRTLTTELLSEPKAVYYTEESKKYLQQLECCSHKRQLDEKENQLTNLKQDFCEKNESLQKKAVELETAKNCIDSLQSKLHEVNELETELQATKMSYQDISDELDKCKYQLNLKEHSLDVGNEKYQNLLEENKKLKMELNELKKCLEDTNHDCSIMQTQLEHELEEGMKLRQDLNILEEKFCDAKQELEAVARHDDDTSKAEFRKYESEMAELERENEKVMEMIKSKTNDDQELRHKFQMSINEIKRLKKIYDETSNKLDDSEISRIQLIKRFESIDADYKEQLNLMQLRVEDLTLKLTKNERRLSTIGDLEIFNNINNILHDLEIVFNVESSKASQLLLPPPPMPPQITINDTSERLSFDDEVTVSNYNTYTNKGEKKTDNNHFCQLQVICNRLSTLSDYTKHYQLLKINNKLSDNLIDKTVGNEDSKNDQNIIESKDNTTNVSNLELKIMNLEKENENITKQYNNLKLISLANYTELLTNKVILEPQLSFKNIDGENRPMHLLTNIEFFYKPVCRLARVALLHTEFSNLLTKLPSQFLNCLNNDDYCKLIKNQFNLVINRFAEHEKSLENEFLRHSLNSKEIKDLETLLVEALNKKQTNNFCYDEKTAYIETSLKQEVKETIKHLELFVTCKDINSYSKDLINELIDIIWKKAIISGQLEYLHGNYGNFLIKFNDHNEIDINNIINTNGLKISINLKNQLNKLTSDLIEIGNKANNDDNNCKQAMFHSQLAYVVYTLQYEHMINVDELKSKYFSLETLSSNSSVNLENELTTEVEKLRQIIYTKQSNIDNNSSELLHAQINLDKIQFEKEQQLSLLHSQVSQMEAEYAICNAQLKKLQTERDTDMDYLRNNVECLQKINNESNKRFEKCITDLQVDSDLRFKNEVNNIEQQLNVERKYFKEELDKLNKIKSDDQVEASLKTRVKQLENELQEVNERNKRQLAAEKAASVRQFNKIHEEWENITRLVNASIKTPNNESKLLLEYRRELETMKELYNKNLALIEISHEKIINDMQKNHQQEIDEIKNKHDQLLKDEIFATQTALDSLRKAHTEELQLEKQKNLELQKKKTTDVDIENIQQQYSNDFEIMQMELQTVNDKMALVNLEKAQLEEKFDLQRESILEMRKIKLKLMERNDELNLKLEHDISSLKNKLASSASTMSGCQLHVADLKLKEIEIAKLQDENATVNDRLDEALKNINDLSRKYKNKKIKHDLVVKKLQSELSELTERLKQKDKSEFVRHGQIRRKSLLVDIESLQNKNIEKQMHSDDYYSSLDIRQNWRLINLKNKDNSKNVGLLPLKYSFKSHSVDDKNFRISDV